LKKENCSWQNAIHPIGFYKMPIPANPRLRSRLFVVLYLEFMLTGAVTTLLGPLMPLLVRRCSMSDAAAGSLVAAQFVGGFMGSLFANRNLRGSVFLGVPLISIGVGALAFSSCNLSYLCAICYGVGLGLTMAAINLIVASRHSEGRASSLTLLNFLWGVGALSSPVLVEWAQRHQCLEWGLMGLSVAGLGLWLATLLGDFPSPSVQGTRSGGSTYSSSLLFFGFLFFLYVGLETSVGDWTALYATRMQHVNDSVAAASVGCFWLALLLGRLLNAALLRRIPEPIIYWLSLTVALGGISLYLFAHSSLQVLLAASATALGLAPIFPLLLSFASDSMLASRNSGWVFSSASLGGALVPWLTGRVSAEFGSLRAAFLVPAAAAALIVVLSLFRLQGNLRSGKPALTLSTGPGAER
jgi:FHS family glucose/mannose:H+ symporter-like MFS transporter